MRIFEQCGSTVRHARLVRSPSVRARRQGSGSAAILATAHGAWWPRRTGFLALALTVVLAFETFLGFDEERAIAVPVALDAVDNEFRQVFLPVGITSKTRPVTTSDR